MATRSAQKKVQDQLDAFVERLSKEVAPFKDTSKEGAKARLEKTKGNTEEFKQMYAPHYVDAPSAKFHADLDAMMNYPEQALFAVHGPREHAKSVQCRLNVMEGIVNGSMQFWVFAAQKVNQAWSHIEYIHADLVNNERIRQDYDIKITRYDSTNGIYRGKATCKATGKQNNFQLQALSDDTSGKGLLFMAKRPQGALVDDLETVSEARNPKNGEKKLNFVLQELYGAITGPLVWLGNMGRKTSALHQAFEHIYQNEDDLKKFRERGSKPGLFAKACAMHGGKINTSDGLDIMRGFIFRADYPDGSTLWPERFSPEWYESKRKALGYRYDGEYNGNPIAPGKIFYNFPRYEISELEGIKMKIVCFTWFDPAWGRKAGSSYKCWVIVGYDGHHFYVLDAYCRQGTKMSEVIDRWYRGFERWGYLGLRDGGFEKTFAQDERFNQDLDIAEEKHGHMLPVYGLDNPGQKEARIESMEGLFEDERVLWPKSLSKDLQTLKQQLENYPDSPYMDGPDALEACINNVKKRFKRGKTQVETLSKRRYNRSRR